MDSHANEYGFNSKSSQTNSNTRKTGVIGQIVLLGLVPGVVVWGGVM